MAMCDTQTLEDSDWEVIEKILDNSIEESMYLKRRERHRWYWMQEQTRDEVLVLAVWDSSKPDSPSGKSLGALFAWYTFNRLQTS